jgi:hypothetical protein
MSNTDRCWGQLLRLALWGVVASGILFGLAACGGEPQELEMAPESVLQGELLDAPASVQEAYRFAVANKELLEQIPCFCGCNSVPHTSNYECYVAEDGGPGSILEYDNHALG